MLGKLGLEEEGALANEGRERGSGRSLGRGLEAVPGRRSGCSGRGALHNRDVQY